MREGTKRTTIILKADDSIIVRTKSRDAATNTYELDGRELKAFGQGVPADVVNLLQLSPINFQSQHDSPFWFNETAGEVSRQLNAVVDLTVIDTTLSNVAQAVRRAQEQKNACEERLAEAEFKLVDLVPQKQRITDLAELKELDKKASRSLDRWTELNRLCTAYTNNTLVAKGWKRKAEDCEAVLELAKSAVVTKRKVEALKEIIEQIKEAKHTPAPPEFAPVTEAFDKWKQIAEDLAELKAVIRMLKDHTNRVAEANKQASVAETKFHLKTKHMKCPLCGQITK